MSSGIPRKVGLCVWIALWGLAFVCNVLAVILRWQSRTRWFQLGISVALNLVSEVLPLAVSAYTSGTYCTAAFAQLFRTLAFSSFCAHFERDVLGWSIIQPLSEDEAFLPPAAVGGKSQTYADPAWSEGREGRYHLRRSDGSRVVRWKVIMNVCNMPIFVALAIGTVLQVVVGKGELYAATTGGYSYNRLWNWYDSDSRLVSIAAILYLLAASFLALFSLGLALAVGRAMVQHHRLHTNARQPFALWFMVIASPFLLADAAWNIYITVLPEYPLDIRAMTWGNLPAWVVAVLLIATSLPEHYQGSFGKGARDIDAHAMEAWRLDEEQRSLDEDHSMRSVHSEDRSSRALMDPSSLQRDQSVHRQAGQETGALLNPYLPSPRR